MSTLVLYNTLSRSKEPFRPLHEDYVGLYTCGPTIYNYAHIGNARPAVVFDLLARILRRRYKLTFARNITDVDDKIIAASQESGEPIEEITARKGSAMPDGLLNALTLQQVADLFAFLNRPPRATVRARARASVPSATASRTPSAERGRAGQVDDGRHHPGSAHLVGCVGIGAGGARQPASARELSGSLVGAARVVAAVEDLDGTAKAVPDDMLGDLPAGPERMGGNGGPSCFFHMR